LPICRTYGRVRSFSTAGNVSSETIKRYVEEQKKKGGVIMEKQEIVLVISNLLTEIIEQYTPFQWVKTAEPFLHPYKVDKISYDYSGEVKPMLKEEFQEIVSTLGNQEWYSSKLEELLHSLHINQWTPTYTSNYGKHWVNYMDLLQDKFNDWKYEHFQLYDEDGNELNEDLEMELDQCLYDFLEHTSHEMYVRKIVKKWG
jgi:hypothetical protein